MTLSNHPSPRELAPRIKDQTAMTTAMDGVRRGLVVAAIGTLAAVGLMVAAPLSASAASTDATNFTMTASSAHLEIGDTVDVTVTGTQLTDVFAYTADLHFDPAVLAYQDGSASTPISGYTSAITAPGSVSVVHTKLGTSPAAEGDLTLTTLRFTAIGSGNAALTLNRVDLVATDSSSVPVETTATVVITVAAAATIPATTIPATTTPATTTPATAGGTTGTASAQPGEGDLASTGLAALPWAGAAALALIAGAVVVAVRRRTERNA
jgi:hypothetical protein